MKNVFLLLSFAIFSSIESYAQDGDPKATEVWNPVPKVITPGTMTRDAPSDAIVLFDGKDLSKWTTDKQEEPKWQVTDNAFTVEKGSGSIHTKQAFGSCQLHIEWRSPQEVKDSGQNRGNSGVFLMGQYELQVLDSYDNITYSNGQAGSIYKQYIPLVNACKPPGEWQTYDVIFTAPEFDAYDMVVSPAKFTVLQNGVLIQNNVELKGGTVYIGQPTYKKHNDKEPIMLQDHNCAVSYRNIWIREL